MKAPIIIIEGPDFSGKTTLALHLASLGYFYLHSSYESLRSWRRTFSANIGRPMVLDRSWMSERVYGPVLRPTANPNSWVQDRILVDRHDPIYIFCQRPFEASFEAQKKDMDHPYAKRAFKKIWKGYQDIYDEFVGDVFLESRTHLFESDTSLNDIPGWLHLHQIPSAYPDIIQPAPKNSERRMTATEISNREYVKEFLDMADKMKMKNGSSIQATGPGTADPLVGANPDGGII